MAERMTRRGRVIAQEELRAQLYAWAVRITRSGAAA